MVKSSPTNSVEQVSSRLNISSESLWWQSLPSLPGVYVFEDKNQNPLYIGKSINLKDRVKQHLEAAKISSSKAYLYVNQSHSLQYQTVKSDLQAIILEANLIKLHQPKYNAISKDNKSLTYITISNPPSPKISTIHATDLILKNYKNYQTQVFGPYLNQKTAKSLLHFVKNIFGYCQSPYNSSHKACFNYHLGLCPGACVGSIAPEKYTIHLNRINRFLSGQFKWLTSTLKKNISKAAKSQNYEAANKYKQSLILLTNSLESSSFRQLYKVSSTKNALLSKLKQQLQHPKLKVNPARIECYDAAHLQTSNYVSAMTVMTDGELDNSEYRLFKVKSADRSDQHVLRHVLERRFKHDNWPKPDLVILDGGIGQLSVCESSIPEDIATIGLSKAHETIHFKNNDGKYISLDWSLDDPCLNLIRQLRDEAHRKAHGFYQKTHRRSILN